MNRLAAWIEDHEAHIIIVTWLAVTVWALA
jgi:hypothetical protein